MCCDGGSAPAPDPAIGQAALANADIAKAQLKIGEDQLAWNKQKYEENAPALKALTDQQIRIGNTNEQRSNEQWQSYKDLFQPLEKTYATEAANEGSDAQQSAEADKARAAVASGYEAQKGAAARSLAQMGVNPNSGKYGDFEMRAGNAQAADEAGAANTARTNARLRGMAVRQGAVQFGRGMPSTGIATDQLALAGANAGGATTNAATMAANAGVNSALPWYSGATSSNQSAGNMYLGQYGAQMQGFQAKTAQDSSMFGGLGQLAGAAMIAFAAKGGVIKKGKAVRKGYSLGGIIGLNTGRKYTSRGFVDGGIVRGPGDGSTDTVPAVVNGNQPAALANGEGVLNEPATKLIGEDFVHRINAAGLILKQIMERGVGVANAPQMQQPVAA